MDARTDIRDVPSVRETERHEERPGAGTAAPSGSPSAAAGPRADQAAAMDSDPGGSAGGGSAGTAGTTGGGGFALEGRRRRSVLSMAPLIDFTFILLIFFMVVTQFDRFTPVDMTVNRSTQAPVTLPPPPPGERKRLHLLVRADGTFLLDGEAIGDVETFTGVLAHHQAPAEADPASRPLLMVEMEDDVSVQLIIDTMQALQKLPGLAVRIVFRPRATAAAAPAGTGAAPAAQPAEEETGARP